MKSMTKVVWGIGLFMAAGCGSADPEPVGSDGAELKRVVTKTATNDQESCFQISADGNITHVFVDTSCDPEQTRVFVDGVEVTRLHDNGGPCRDVERKVWFPLTGNQDEATVCVETTCSCPGDVEVGYKVRGECFDSSPRVCDTTTILTPITLIGAQ